MEKLKKTARGLDAFFKVLLWFMVILAAVMITATAVLCRRGAGDLSNSLVLMQLSINGILLDPRTVLSEAIYKKVWISTLLHFLILFAFTCYGICIIRRMLSLMKDGKPFNSGVARDFKRLGWFSILFGISYEIFDNTFTTSLARLISASVSSFAESHTYNLNFLIIAFVFFLLSYIFSYGEELQRLSDETL